MTGVAGTCPSCGAPLAFGGADSLVVVCSHCRSAVARKGADFSLVGWVPDLVATDSRLALSASGALGGKAFTVLGHLQLRHGSAGSAWDEWYVSFADGGWGWLAEAQGHLIYTRYMSGERELPRWGSLHAGRRIEDITGAGTITVDEVNEASFAAAEGELPFRPEVGAVYRFADCSTPEGAFVTLDYGSRDSDPEMFAGREITYAQAGLEKYQPPPARAPEGRALTCPNCGGQLSLKLTSSESVACPGCHSLLDVTSGAAGIISRLHHRAQPPLPLGARGRIEGNDYEVIGWLKRKVRIDSIDYFWDEYLLHGNVGYRWLSESAGHWLFLSPVPGGKVERDGTTVVCDGRRFKHFQSAQARYAEVQGEFYWRVEAEHPVHTEDYVAPPYLLSVEEAGGEANWSRGESLSGSEVWAAFGQTDRPPFPVGVGAAEPNPYSGGRLGRAWTASMYALVAITAISVALAVLHPSREVVDVIVPLRQVTLSDPFPLEGGPQAVEVLGSADVNQAWVGVDVSLINDLTGESDSVGFELSHYHGVSDGESWSEGSRSGSSVIGHVPDGRYLLRVETETARDPNGSLPYNARVKLRTGVFLATPLLFAILLTLAYPFWLTWKTAEFEKQRWSESDHAWGES